MDKKTDEYYQSVEGPFGEELRRKIDRAHNPAEIKLENGYCPFLNEEKLCRVYIELGPEHMCDICRKYPRREVLAGDIIFHYLTISCPEVGRIFLSRKAPMKIRVIEDESPFIPLSVRNPDWNFFQCATSAFETNLAILQNRSHSVAERERALLLFNRALQDALDAGKMAEAETLIRHFSEPSNYDALIHSKLPAHLPSKVRLFRELSELLLTREEAPGMLQIFVESVRYIQSENADMDKLSRMFKTLDEDSFQREQESVLTYLLFRHYLSNDLLDKNAKRDLFGNAVFSLLLFQFYRIFTAILSTIDGEIVDLNTRTLIISHLSRCFEHDLGAFRKSIHEALEKHQLYDLGFLFQLIS